MGLSHLFLLSVVMAQMGSYVPADSIDLPVFDAIYTRIGAADDLIQGSRPSWLR